MAAIGLVVGNPGAPSGGDSALKTLLETVPHTVTYVDDAAAVPGGFDLFVLSESSSPFSLLDKYTAIAVPVVCLEIGSYIEMGLAAVDGTAGASGTTYDLLVHAITAGLPDPCTVRTSAAAQYSVLNTDLCAGAEPFARVGTDATRTTGWAVSTGGSLTTGTAAARRVALGYIDSWPPNLTADGQTLFLQAVTWAEDAATTPNQGSFTGGFNFAGAFTGHSAEAHGSFTGGFAFAGDFAGSRVSSGDTAGGFSFTANFIGSDGPSVTEVLFFDGIDDYVTVPNTGGLLAPTEQTTWEIRFKVGSTPDAFDTLMGFLGNDWDIRHDSATSMQAHWWDDDGEQTFNGFSVAETMYDSEWHHLAMVWDGTNGTRRTRLDGVEVFTSTVSMTAPELPRDHTATQTFWIGAVGATGQRFFNGFIDEVRVWSTARTNTEIDTNATAVLTGGETGLRANWRFNDGSGTTLTDYGPNGLHGTISGAQWVSASTGAFTGGFSFDGAFTGSRRSAGDLIGSVLFTGIVTGSAPSVLFTPPSFEEGIQTRQKPLSYFRTTVSVSVVRVNGTFTSIRHPYVEQLDAAGVEGTDFFIGGHVYPIDDATATELAAAGYTIGA